MRLFTCSPGADLWASPDAGKTGVGSSSPARARVPARRRGVAAVELGFVALLFLVPLLIGVWETGRLVHVQQVVANSAREGARVAAQGFIIKADGTQVQIRRAGGSPSVKGAVVEYLRGAGLTNLTADDVIVEFTFTTPRVTAYVAVPGLDAAGTSYPAGTFPPEPCFGEKGQQFTVRVSVPWEKVRWVSLGILRPKAVEFTATWWMLMDDEFEVATSLPTW